MKKSLKKVPVKKTLKNVAPKKVMKKEENKAKIPMKTSTTPNPSPKRKIKTPTLKEKANTPIPKKIAKTPIKPRTPRTRRTAIKPKHELSIKDEKNKNFGKWYQQTIIKSEMIEYYNVSGCYIIRPYAYSIWERIQEELNKRIKEQGVKNAYFPLLTNESELEKEESHIEGFKKEVAYIENDDLFAERIALRPSSESIFYPAYSKWIRSHRDLPLKLNQWANIVRWEFNDTMPFIRSKEFLWQEGHTAHATAEEAQEFALKMNNIYSEIFEDLLAIPSVKGEK